MFVYSIWMIYIYIEIKNHVLAFSFFYATMYSLFPKTHIKAAIMKVGALMRKKLIVKKTANSNILKNDSFCFL